MSYQIEARAAIRTRFKGPTNSNGSRIIAYREGWSDIPAQKKTFNYDYSLNGDANHMQAAQDFLDKFNPGNVVNSKAYCFDGDYYWTWVHTKGEV